jgi:lipoyl(octanoyl) transferase
VQLRLIDDDDGEPAWNMALDEALLRAADRPTLRLYGWRPHAVSLGYFQRLRDFADLPAGTRIVRRPTGGGAIHHAEELTFALALDADCLPADLDRGYELLHDALVRALRCVGVIAHRLQHGSEPSARPVDRWCFASPGRHDLVAADGRKLCGSAQRRIRTDRGARVLHHGSIVLQRPPLTPFVAAVADATNAALAAPPLRRELAREFAAVLALQPTTAAPTATELAIAATLRRDRYANAAFLASR